MFLNVGSLANFEVGDSRRSFYSLYNTVMKIAYIAATAAIIAMARGPRPGPGDAAATTRRARRDAPDSPQVRLKSPWKFKYDRTQDAFLHWQFAVAPCAVARPRGNGTSPPDRAAAVA